MKLSKTTTALALGLLLVLGAAAPGACAQRRVARAARTEASRCRLFPKPRARLSRSPLRPRLPRVTLTTLDPSASLSSDSMTGVRAEDDAPEYVPIATSRPLRTLALRPRATAARAKVVETLRSGRRTRVDESLRAPNRL